MKESVDGWFKLLSQEEGDFYAVPVLGDEGPMGKAAIAVRRRNGENRSKTKRRSLGSHSNHRNSELERTGDVDADRIVAPWHVAEPIVERNGFSIYQSFGQRFLRQSAFERRDKSFDRDDSTSPSFSGRSCRTEGEAGRTLCNKNSEKRYRRARRRRRMCDDRKTRSDASR